MQAPECVGSVVAACGLSSCGVCALERAGSVVVVHGLSCPAACGILVPQPGIEPTSPALEDGFLTTGPPGRSHVWILFSSLCVYISEVFDLWLP